MITIQKGEINCNNINGHWGYRELTAERKQGDCKVKISVPAGPRSSKSVTFTVEEEEFIKLAQWMRGEIR